MLNVAFPFPPLFSFFPPFQWLGEEVENVVTLTFVSIYILKGIKMNSKI